MLHGMQILMRDIQARCVQIQVLAQAHANKQVQTFLTSVYSLRGELEVYSLRPTTSRRAAHNFAPNCDSVTPLPMAAVDEMPPVTVLSRLSA